MINVYDVVEMTDVLKRFANKKGKMGKIEAETLAEALSEAGFGSKERASRVYRLIEDGKNLYER